MSLSLKVDTNYRVGSRKTLRVHASVLASARARVRTCTTFASSRTFSAPQRTPPQSRKTEGKETTDEEEEHGGDEGELARPACKLLQADQSVRCLWEVQFCFRLRVQVMHAGHFPPAPGNLGERFPGGTSPWGTSSGKTKLVPRGDVPLGGGGRSPGER